MPRTRSVTRHVDSRPGAAGARGLVLLAGVLGFLLAAVPAAASCFPAAHGPAGPESGLFVPAAWHGARLAERGSDVPALTVELTFLGHASFLIRTPDDVAAITDYNGYIRARYAPDIVTMNRAHRTHYTDDVEPGVEHVLRGWDEDGGIPRHSVTLRDLHVRNVPTNIRDGIGGTRYAENSIFIFETAGLCIAHLGHLHHPLEDEHIGQIGMVDVLLAPIDDGYTMRQTRMVEAIEALAPDVVVPMHYAGQTVLARFLALMRDRDYAVRVHEGPGILLSRRELPRRTVLVLPGGRF